MIDYTASFPQTAMKSVMNTEWPKSMEENALWINTEMYMKDIYESY